MKTLSRVALIITVLFASSIGLATKRDGLWVSARQRGLKGRPVHIVTVKCSHPGSSDAIVETYEFDLKERLMGRTGPKAFTPDLMFVDRGRSLTAGTSSQQQPPQRKDSVPDHPKLSQVLLKISFDGGLVPDRNNVTGGHPGHSEFIVTRKGNYSFSGDVRPKTKGALSKFELDELTHQINTADFVVLKSKKFTGECPTAYDGDEVTYTFYTKVGFEVIASCKVAIDPKSELFLTVWEIYQKYRT